MRAAIRENPARVLLAVAVATSGTVLIAWLSQLTFFFDEWDPLLDRRGLSAHVLLAPHVDHILLGPTVFYKSIQATIGMESLVPYALVSTIVFLVSAILLWIYLSRRVGEWLALAGVLPVLFLGAAHEDLLWPFEISFTASIAAGLGSLLLLERADRGQRDAIACVLLIVSLTFSELALSFALGAAVLIALAGGPWRRAYVPGLPVVLYLLWYAGWGHTGEHHLTFHALANSPSYVLDGLAASIASLLGLADDPTGGLGWGRPLLVALLIVAFIRVVLRRRWSPSLWVALSVLLSFWFLLAANAGLGRDPIASRYQYVGVVLLLLVVAELFHGTRLNTAGTAAVLAVATFAALTGASILHDNYKLLASLTTNVRGGLGGLEIAADSANPDLVLNQQNSTVNYLDAVRAGPYLSAVDAFGSPADDPAELENAPEGARVAADKVMAAALGVRVQAADQAGPAAPAPRLIAATGATAQAKSACVALTANAPAPAATFRLPPGGVLVQSPEGGQLSLRRFAQHSFPVAVGSFHGTRSIPIPPDRSSRAWQLQASGFQRLRACGVAEPG